MSSTLKPQTLGRRPEDGLDRAAMLSRLGIAEVKPAEPELDTSQVEALAAPPPEEAPVPTPALTRLRALVAPANDEQVEAVEDKPAFAIPEPPAQAEVEEDPFAAIRERYRNPPKGMTLGSVTLPSNIPIPTSLPPIPNPLKIAPVGERRRKGGELTTIRKAIWALTWLAAGAVGWALLTADESSPLIQLAMKVLP